MSTSSNNIVKPEWLGNLETQLEQHPKFVSYALSTISPEGKPKVRFVIHRGVTPSGLLLTTTDTRMQKPNHLSHDPTVELAWWIEEPAIQFRITGKAYTIPPDSEESVQKVLDQIGLDGSGEDHDAKWWSEKREEVWKGLSGHLRGSFGRPPPGKKLEEVEAKPEDWITRLEVESDDPKEKKDIEWAKSHFAMIAIKATNAEMLELKPSPNIRTQFNIQEDGSWERVSVCP